MTELRDQIAIAAMQALMAYKDSPPLELAREAYAMADFMLTARKHRDWTVGGAE